MATHTELFEVSLAEALAVNPSLSEEVARTEGSSLNTVLHAIAACGEEVAWQAAERYAALFLDTASGSGLHRLVADRYGIQPFGATAAVVELTISRTIAVADLTVAAGESITTLDRSATFTLDYDVELPIGVTSASGTATSTKSGSDQRVEAGQLTVWIGGAPATDATITNADVSAGGCDPEDDAALRTRARAVWMTARRGTLSAILQGAMGVDKVRKASAYEVLDDDGHPVGGDVRLVVADESGVSNATLNSAVELELDEWRAAGIWVGVEGATPDDRAISVEVVFESGAGTLDRRNALRRAVVALVNRLQPNGGATAADAPATAILYPGLVESARLLVPGIVRLTCLDPAAPEAPDHGHVIRTNFGLVTVS